VRRAPGSLDRAFRLASDLVARGDAPPTVLAVSDARRTIRAEAFGTQDGVPITTEVAAPIFSVTKPMIAAAVAQLWERGRIQLFDTVASWLPGYEAQGKQGVLIRHLLTHTSGISEMPAVEAMRRGAGPREVEAAILSSPLDAPPGTKQRYSNASFVALGMIISKASGMTLAEYLSREVFAPLAMTRTGFDPARLPAPRAAPHSAACVLRVPNLPDLGMSPTLESFITLELAAAGLFSTAEDIASFGRAFLNGGRGPRGRILGPATVQAMLTPQTPGIPPFVPGDFDGWVLGLGWYLCAPPHHKVIAGDAATHSGAGGCQVFVSREWGVAVAVVTAKIRHRTERLVNAVLGCLGT
jgi:CubicO group peptidase (beta-lactamase class C family)